jgi:type IV pilus assembly protein PilV
MNIPRTFFRAPFALRQKGMTLVEILVSIVILLIGLLGLAGLIVRSNQGEMESYQRIQALQLLQDMSERLRANGAAASCYSDGATGLTLGTGRNEDIPLCTASSTTQQQKDMAQRDLEEWDASLKGGSEITAYSSKAGAMIGAIGCISYDSALDEYLIAVSWQGLMPTSGPELADGSPFPCGNGLYGDEVLHRAVTTKVSLRELP